MSVRPEFGPTLPVLLRTRLGVSPWVTAIALAALVGAGLLLVFTRGTAGGRADLVHRGDPAFNLLYEERLVRPAPPEADELARLEARRPRVQATLTVRALPDSDLPFGALPVHAEQHIDSLREELGAVRISEEGKARIWGHPGYRIRYRAGRVAGTDVLLFFDDTAMRGGAVVSFRQPRSAGRLGTRDRAAINEVRRVMRSFQFGADRR